MSQRPGSPGHLGYVTKTDFPGGFNPVLPGSRRLPVR